MGPEAGGDAVGQSARRRRRNVGAATFCHTMDAARDQGRDLGGWLLRHDSLWLAAAHGMNDGIFGAHAAGGRGVAAATEAAAASSSACFALRVRHMTEMDLLPPPSAKTDLEIDPKPIAKPQGDLVMLPKLKPRRLGDVLTSGTQGGRP